jgi:polyphosphate kinase
MPRNLDRRVEVLMPVVDKSLRDRLAEIQDIALADDMLAWELSGDEWRKVPTTAGHQSQRELEERALARSHPTTRGVDA